jgi:4-aminobutyrate aminotransferase-like enzyme
VKLDLINGIGIHILGHSHPSVTKAAVRGALSDAVMQGNLQPNKEYLELSEKMLEIARKGSRLNHIWFATCGTIANENATTIATPPTDWQVPSHDGTSVIRLRSMAMFDLDGIYSEINQHLS